MIIDAHDYHTTYREIRFSEYKENKFPLIIIKFSEGDYLKADKAVDDAQKLHELGYIVGGYCFARPIGSNGNVISGKEHADCYLDATENVRDIIAVDVLDGPELIKIRDEWYNDPFTISNDMAFDVVHDFFHKVKSASPENIRLFYDNLGAWWSFFYSKWQGIEDKENHWFNDRSLITGSWEALYGSAPRGFGPFSKPILWQFSSANISIPPFPIKGVYRPDSNIKIDSDKNKLMIPLDEFIELVPEGKRGRYEKPPKPPEDDPQIDPPVESWIKRLLKKWLQKIKPM